MPGESGEWLGRKSRSANVAVVRIPVDIPAGKTDHSTTFQILPAWLAAGAAWHTSSVGSRRRF